MKRDYVVGTKRPTYVTVVDSSGAPAESFGGSGTQYAEDAAHASGNTGTLALVVRSDTATATAANGDYVPLLVDANGALHTKPAAGEVHLGQVGGTIAMLTAATFTRPADTTAYAIGDLVANSTTAGSVTPLTYTAATRVAAGSGTIRRMLFSKSTVTTTAAAFRIHVYSASPVVTNGDNGAWLSDQRLAYLGSFDVTTGRVFSDGALGVATPTEGFDMDLKLASGQTLYMLVEARGAYAPGDSEIFTVRPIVWQD